MTDGTTGGVRAPRGATPVAVPAVRARSLVRRYRDVTALAGIDLEVVLGEAVGIIGPNGAGKTTFLDLVSGLLRPTSGQIEVAGARPGSGQAVRALGRMFEDPVTFTHLRPRRIARALGMSTAARHEFDRLVDELRVPHRRTGSFSKGELTRLGLAVAMAPRPAVLALDEPTSGLDPETAESVELLVRNYTSQGAATVLVATHRIEDLRVMTDRTVLFDRGRILASMPTSEFLGMAVRVEIPAADADALDALCGDLPHRLVPSADGAVEVVSADPRTVTERLEGELELTIRPSLASALRRIRFRNELEKEER